MSSLVFVNIDVSQARLDIAVRPGTSFTIPHGESAIAALVQQLCALSPTPIVLEATGGMEIRLTSALATAGLPVVVVNLRQVRDFAKASGHLAKTDALDAQVLAPFAEVMRPLPDAETPALAALLTRRRQRGEMLPTPKRIETPENGSGVFLWKPTPASRIWPSSFVKCWSSLTIESGRSRLLVTSVLSRISCLTECPKRFTSLILREEGSPAAASVWRQRIS